MAFGYRLSRRPPPRVSIPADEYVSFKALGNVNGVTCMLIFDTGAYYNHISPALAEHLGYPLRALWFNATASSIDRAIDLAPLQLRLEIGSIAVESVQFMVSKPWIQDDTTVLIGTFLMNWLGYRIESGVLSLG